MAPLCYAAKFDPILFFYCAPKLCPNPPMWEGSQFCHLDTLPGEERVEGGAPLADALHWFLLGVDSRLIPDGLRPVDEIPLRTVSVFQGRRMKGS